MRGSRPIKRRWGFQRPYRLLQLQPACRTEAYRSPDHSQCQNQRAKIIAKRCARERHYHFHFASPAHSPTFAKRRPLIARLRPARQTELANALQDRPIIRREARADLRDLHARRILSPDKIVLLGRPTMLLRSRRRLARDHLGRGRQLRKQRCKLLTRPRKDVFTRVEQAESYLSPLSGIIKTTHGLLR